ncbi:MAG: hypothetical protein MI748_00115 [Opitutales bacterium]|nr:hypothetical protein [Opitutales bacterium]
MKILKNYWLPFVALIIGALLVFFPPKRLQGVDQVADEYFEDSVTKATLAYGTARVVNAGVSVVKDSTLQLEPGGVGVAVAVGQVADPLDDMTERLSSVLVTSIVSLLVQKITYEIAQAFVFQVIGVVLVVAAVLGLFPKSAYARVYRNLFLKVVLFLVVVRLFLPFSAMISHHLNESLFFPRIAEHQEKLEPLVSELGDITKFEVPEIKGLGDIFSGPVSAMSEKRQQLNVTMAVLVSNGYEIFQNMLAVTALYLGIFVIQVLFLPILMFWLLNKLLFVLFSHQIPYPPLTANRKSSEPSQS